MPLDPKRPTSRNRPATTRSSPLDNLRKPNPALPSIPKSSTSRMGTSRTSRPTTSRMGRPATSRTARGTQGEEGEEGVVYAEPPKKSNTPVIVGICAGAAVLLLIIIVAASGGGRSYGTRVRSGEDSYQEPVVKDYSAEKPKEVLKFDGQRWQDTGALVFICANSGKHEDKEVEINICSKCEKKNFFCQARGSIYCWNCEVEFPLSTLKCPECSASPRRPPRIKHK